MQEKEGFLTKKLEENLGGGAWGCLGGWNGGGEEGRVSFTFVSPSHNTQTHVHVREGQEERKGGRER